MLELKNIHAGYRKGHWILEGIDLQIAEGETLGVIGKNGSGKSTLAKSIMGLTPFREGQIIFKGKDISRLTTPEISREGIGYFMQGGEIFPNLTTIDNLVFAGRNQNKQAFKKRLKQIIEYINFLGINEKLELKASYLSGGEKHQLALAMVLIHYPKPEFLILDEPSAGLSQANILSLYETIGNIRNEENLTILLVEQNLPMVFKTTKRLVHIKDKEAIVFDSSQKRKEIIMNEFISN